MRPSGGKPTCPSHTVYRARMHGMSPCRSRHPPDRSGALPAGDACSYAGFCAEQVGTAEFLAPGQDSPGGRHRRRQRREGIRRRTRACTSANSRGATRCLNPDVRFAAMRFHPVVPSRPLAPTVHPTDTHGRCSQTSWPAWTTAPMAVPHVRPHAHIAGVGAVPADRKGCRLGSRPRDAGIAAMKPRGTIACGPGVRMRAG
jgi:hypothetical protein